MYSSLPGLHPLGHLPRLRKSNSKTLDLHSRLWFPEIHPLVEKSRPSVSLRFGQGRVITMRDRSKNRKPMQRGRHLSIEAIQAVQALKRAKISGGDSLERAFESKVRRLIKFDLIAVLRELQKQNEGLLAFQVFEEVRKEYWYKPQLSVYVDMITVLASNGFLEKVEQLCSYLKMECLEADTEGFNILLRTLLEFGFTRTAMDCFRLMKLWESEPDESTFKILICGLESKGEMELSNVVRQEAEKSLGGSLEFLEDKEEMLLTGAVESV